MGLFSGMPDDPMMTPNPGLASIGPYASSYGPPPPPMAPPPQMPDLSTLPIHDLRPMPGAYDPISGPANESIDARMITAGNVPLESASQRPSVYELPAQVMSASSPPPGPPPASANPMPMAKAPGGGIGAGGELGKLRSQSKLFGEQIIGDQEQARDAQERLETGMAAAKAAEAERLAGNAARMEAFNEQALRDQQTRDAAYEKAGADLQSAENEFAKEKVDAKGIFANADVGTKVMATLGAALSGFLQPIAGMKNNPFIDAIREANQQNISAQEKNIALKGRSLDGKRSGLQMMRQRMGDAEQAKMLESNRMLQFMKMKGDELAAQSGSVEAQNRWGVHGAQLQEEIDKNRKALLDARAQQIVAQSAAAAAQRTAAEKLMFDRSVKIAELSQADRKIAADEAKGAREVTSRETEGISKRLTELKIPEAETSLRTLENSLSKEDGTIPGIGPGADARASVPLIGERFLLDDKERVSRVNFNRLFDQYKVAVTGAGASESEIESLRKSFAGAKTPAEQQNVLQTARAVLERQKSNVLAGYNPEAVATFNQRMNNSSAPDMPTSVKKEK